MVLMPLLSRLLTLLDIKSKDRKSGSAGMPRSEERFSRNAETDLVCRLLLEKKKGGAENHAEEFDNSVNRRAAGSTASPKRDTPDWRHPRTTQRNNATSRRAPRP